MMSLVIVIHVIVCVALIILVLIQRGRGSGLVESFAGVESLFGTKTSTFLTKATTILSTVFFFTCLILAVLSIRQSRSLMRDIKIQPQANASLPANSALNQTGALPAPAALAPQNSTQP